MVTSTTTNKKQQASPMNLLGNLIWLIFGGLIAALEYFISSIALMVTIIGLPFARQHFKLAQLALTPFGYDIHTR